MKLLVDARPIVDPTPGGIPRVSRALLAAYVRMFPDDEIICATTGVDAPSLPSELMQYSHVRHVHIHIPNKLWSARCLLSNASLIQSMRSRIGHLDAVFLPNLGFTGALPANLPTTLLVHDLSFLIEPRWFVWKQRMWHIAVRARLLLQSAAHLLAVSKTTKRDAMRLLKIPEERITVLPIGQTFPCTVNTCPPSRTILVFGPNDPRKNTATAVEAVRRLREEEHFHNVTLTIVCAQRTSETRIAGARHAFPLPAFLRESWINIVNVPSDTELAKLYSTASAFLYPSWYEGFGLPLHEAASCGVPCIASTAGALPETAPPHTLFADPAKPHHWAAALRSLLSSAQTPRQKIIAHETAWDEAAAILRHTLRSLSADS